MHMATARVSRVRAARCRKREETARSFLIYSEDHWNVLRCRRRMHGNRINVEEVHHYK